MATSPNPQQPPVLWRTKLRSTVISDHFGQVEHCRNNNLIGIGWGIPTMPDGAAFEQVRDWIEKCPEPGWGRRAASTVRLLAVVAQPGDFVWTRHTNGEYLLCKITGAYRYDSSEAASAADVHQTRRVEWAARTLNDLDVPGAVIRSFVGRSSSFCQIHDANAKRLTPYLWEKFNDRPLPVLDVTPEDVLKSYLDPYDVEDLVYVWLQAERDYVVLPQARKVDTPVSEWTVIHRRTGSRGIAQVKTGNEPVDLAALSAARPDSDTVAFAFSTEANYLGGGAGIERIDSSVILDFVAARPELLPSRVRTWFEMATS